MVKACTNVVYYLMCVIFKPTCVASSMNGAFAVLWMLLCISMPAEGAAEQGFLCLALRAVFFLNTNIEHMIFIHRVSNIKSVATCIISNKPTHTHLIFRVMFGAAAGKTSPASHMRSFLSAFQRIFMRNFTCQLLGRKITIKSTNEQIH